jgi:hypothetical protein
MYRFIAPLAAVLALAFTREAGAVEQEHHLGVDLGLSILTINDQSAPDVGPAFGLHYTYGITDQVNLIAGAQYSLVALNANATTPPTYTHPTNLFNADVGVAYVLDVLRWVPYFGGLAGAYVLDGGTIQGNLFLPGAQVVVGLDYLLTPVWSVGIEGSEHFLFTDMSLYTSFTNVVARVQFIWGR